jgi:ribosomal protein L37E
VRTDLTADATKNLCNSCGFFSATLRTNPRTAQNKIKVKRCYTFICITYPSLCAPILALPKKITYFFKVRRYYIRACIILYAHIVFYVLSCHFAHQSSHCNKKKIQGKEVLYIYIYFTCIHMYILYFISCPPLCAPILAKPKKNHVFLKLCNSCGFFSVTLRTNPRTATKKIKKKCKVRRYYIYIYIYSVLYTNYSLAR